MWTTYREAGRPIPKFSDDDYIDYCILEAISLRIAKEKQKAQKDAERQQKVREAKERLAKQNAH